MEISDDELMMLPFDVTGNKDYLKTYPKLSSNPDFGKENRKEIKDFNRTFKYIVLLYTPNTPLLRISDYAERRKWAVRKSGVSENDIRAASSLIIGYLRLQRNDKWTKLSVYRDAFYNQSLRLQSDDTKSGERTAALLDNIDKIEGRIESALSELSNGDTRIKDIIIDAIEDERLSNLRPEMIATAKEDGKDIIEELNPYKGARQRTKKAV